MTTVPDDQLPGIYKAFDRDHDRLRDELMASLPEETPHPRTLGLARRGWRWMGATTTRRRVLGAVAAAIPILVGGALIFTLLVPPRNGSAIALAEVISGLKRDVEQNDYIHFVVTGYRPLPRDKPGQAIDVREVWAQRPSDVRWELRLWSVGDRHQSPLGSLRHHGVFKSIWKEEGQYNWDEERKQWGFIEGEDTNPDHKMTYRQSHLNAVQYALAAKFYTKYDWEKGTHESPKGRPIGHERVHGQSATVYEFEKYEGKIHKCWLRDSDRRLLRLKVYEVGKAWPVATLEILDYQGPPPEGIFDPKPWYKIDLAKARRLGYEDQPQLINPHAVAVVQDDGAAHFYRLDIRPGQSRAQAVAAAIAANEPALEVLVSQEGTLDIKARPPADAPDQRPLTVHHPSAGPMTTPQYGVLLNEPFEPKGPLFVIMDRPPREGKGQLVFQFVYYRTRDKITYCKVAFDADGDGKMDAWCQVPSDDVAQRRTQSSSR